MQAGQARQFHHGVGEQAFVAGIIIDHEGTLPVLQEVPGMFAAPVGLVVEEDEGVSLFEIATSVGPEEGA